MGRAILGLAGVVVRVVLLATMKIAHRLVPSAEAPTLAVPRDVGGKITLVAHVLVAAFDRLLRLVRAAHRAERVPILPQLNTGILVNRANFDPLEFAD